MSFVYLVRLTPPTLAVVAYLSLLVMVIRAPRKTVLYYVFGVFLISLALWAFFLLGLRSTDAEPTALLWQRLMLVSVFATATSFVHFVLVLTRRASTLVRVVPLYAGAAVLSIVAVTPLVVGGMELRSYGWSPLGGPLFDLWMAFSMAALLAAVVVLGFSFRRVEVVEEQNRYLVLGLGAVCGVVGLASDYLAAQGLMAYPLGIFGNLALGILTAMASMRAKLIDVQLVVRRGIVYIAFSAVVATVYLLILLGISRFLAQQTGFSFAVQVIVMFVLVLLFQPAARYLQEVADRWLYGRRYDYLRLLRAFSARSQRVVELPVLARDLTDAIRLAMRTQGVWLLLPNPKGDYEPVLEKGNGPTLGGRSSITSWLARETRPLWRHQLDGAAQFRGVPSEELDALRSWNVRLLIPMHTPSGLTGVLALGPRETLEPYSQAEVDTLYTVAQQVAILLENSRLFTLEREQVRVLQEVDRMKTDFLGMVSHQLKTPITAIKAAMELLGEAESMQSSSARARLMANMKRNVATLEQLVSDLLDFAKVRAGQVTIDRSPVELQVLVRETVSLLSPPVQAKEQKIVVDVPPDPVVVRGDSHRLSQVLVNLLSNASKYSPSGSDITVRLERQGDEALVSVTDACGGIPPADRPYLFEAYRLPRSQSVDAAAPGAGLGLSIAKALTELHGGRIWVTDHPGRGCTFTFSLPLNVPQPGPATRSG